MSSVSGFNGVYAVEWAQTAPGEEWGLPPDLLSVGLSWRWRGDAQRLDARVAALWLEAPRGHVSLALRARQRARRLALFPPEPGASFRGASLSVEAPRDGAGDVDPDRLDDVTSDLPGSFTLTDGRRLYSARIVRQGRRLLAVFHPLLPPPDR